MDVLEAIERRVSVRAYDPEPLDAAQLDAVRDAGEGAPHLTRASMRFVLDADGAAVEGGMTGVAGDYGKLIHGPHYAVLACSEAPGYLVDAGFRFETMVLAATAAGIGTCWIGGFFHEARLRAALGLPDRMRIVALTPLGRAATGGARGLLARVTRSAIGATRRRPLEQLVGWEAAGEPLPGAVTGHDGVMRWLEAIRRAPSWANKQPWRFVLGRHELTLYKQARQHKEGKDYHLVDCGIAMAHAALAGAALGLDGRWQLVERAAVALPDDAEPIGRYAFDHPLRV